MPLDRVIVVAVVLVLVFLAVVIGVDSWRKTKRELNSRPPKH